MAKWQSFIYLLVWVAMSSAPDWFGWSLWVLACTCGQSTGQLPGGLSRMTAFIFLVVGRHWPEWLGWLRHVSLVIPETSPGSFLWYVPQQQELESLNLQELFKHLLASWLLKSHWPKHYSWQTWIPALNRKIEVTFQWNDMQRWKIYSDFTIYRKTGGINWGNIIFKTLPCFKM